VLVILTRPFNLWKKILVASMGALFLGALVLPFTRSFFALDLPDPLTFFASLGIAAIACAVLELGWRLAGWVDRTPGLPDLGLVDPDDEE
jgi:cation-transporting ATPase E